MRVIMGGGGGRRVSGGRLLLGLLAAVALGLLAVFFLGVVVAVIAPLVALGYAVRQFRWARDVSNLGRVSTPHGMRLVSADERRWWSASHMVAGVSGLALGVAPVLWLWSGAGQALGALVLGFLGQAWARWLRERGDDASPPVEILPPE